MSQVETFWRLICHAMLELSGVEMGKYLAKKLIGRLRISGHIMGREEMEGRAGIDGPVHAMLKGVFAIFLPGASKP